MIVIGDVHGCAKTLEALLAKLPKDQVVVMSGDLIDRGPNSADVIKLVRERNILCVKGNHEDMMTNALIRDVGFGDFLYNGGRATLSSYGIDSGLDYEVRQQMIKDNARLQDDLAWMDALPVFLEFPECVRDDGKHLLVSHSSAHGVWNFKDNKQRKELFVQSLIWNRLPNIQEIPGIYNIFGHTPHRDNPRIKTCYANVDTGCCFAYHKKEGFGLLTGLQFPEMIVHQQENIDTIVEPEKEEFND